MTNLDVGHHADHAVNHAETCSEDGDDGKLLAGNTLAFCNGDGRLNVDLFKREISGGFIAHQHCDLRNKLSELLDAGVFIAEDGQLVLNKGMVEHAYFAHLSCSPLYSI